MKEVIPKKVKYLKILKNTFCQNELFFGKSIIEIWLQLFVEIISRKIFSLLRSIYSSMVEAKILVNNCRALNFELCFTPTSVSQHFRQE